MIPLRSPYSPFLFNRLSGAGEIEATIQHHERWGFVAVVGNDISFIEQTPRLPVGTKGVIRFIERNAYFLTKDENRELIAKREAEQQAAREAEERAIAQAVAKATEEASTCSTLDEISALRNRYGHAYRSRFRTPGTPARYAAFKAVGARYHSIAVEIMARFPYAYTVQTASHPRIGVNDYEPGGDHIVLSEPITRGRLKRAAGDPLCKGPKDAFFGPNDYTPSCARCLRLAERFANQTTNKRNDQETKEHE
jgi:hypothetical protein